MHCLFVAMYVYMYVLGTLKSSLLAKGLDSPRLNNTNTKKETMSLLPAEVHSNGKNNWRPVSITTEQAPLAMIR